MRASNLLPSFSNPGQLAQGAVGKLGGGASGLLHSMPGAAASNQQQSDNPMQNAAGGLSGLFGGKKK
jgi:hypothetical protein